MATPADLTKDLSGTPLMDDQIRVQLNNVIASLRLLTAKLDADAGVTDTNFAALITNSGVATAPAKIV